MQPSQHIQDRLETCASAVNTRLAVWLDDVPRAGEQMRVPRLMQAMRHGVLNGGKRLRPFLVIECAGLFGVAREDALETACALECLHSYSLVHDDLPAMDDDDLRRGQPTVHKAYDEATAILAGDALLTLAFEIVCGPSGPDDPAIRARLSHMLAQAAGLGGMIGGQMLDIEAEIRTLDDRSVRTLQAMKTGALLRFACQAGAVLGHADTEAERALIRYGETTGLAFQLADDLLDVTSSSDVMGKAVGKDAAAGKGTLVGLHGEEAVKQMLESSVEEACAALEPFGKAAALLRDAARFIAFRSS